jgi:hypothetical protein
MNFYLRILFSERLDFHRTEGLVGIHTQANFGKVAKGSNAYFSGLYQGIVGGLKHQSLQLGLSQSPKKSTGFCSKNKQKVRFNRTP